MGIRNFFWIAIYYKYHARRRLQVQILCRIRCLHLNQNKDKLSIEAKQLTNKRRSKLKIRQTGKYTKNLTNNRQKVKKKKSLLDNTTQFLYLQRRLLGLITDVLVLGKKLLKNYTRKKPAYTVYKKRSSYSRLRFCLENLIFVQVRGKGWVVF